VRRRFDTKRLRVTPRSPLRLVQLGAAGLLAVGIGGFALASGAEAQVRATTTTTTTTTTSGSAAAINPNTFDLSAEAEALDVLVTDPNLPLSGLLTIEASPWGASASLNSLGQSMADAGAPYSPAIYSLPGTVNGLGIGVLPPLPPLPGYVSASYPSTPSDDQTQGGYQITSDTSSSDAKGAVTIGVQPTGSSNATVFASAETSSKGDGSVNVTASAGVDALSFGQLFDIANVSNSLSMTQQANGQPTVTSTTKLGTITLLGQASGLQGAGVSVFGINVPIDISGVVISALNTLLAPSGISLTYLPETFVYTDGTSSTGSTPDSSKTLQSIDSGALKITVTENVPSQGPVSVSFTLGRVYLSTTDVPGSAPTVGNTGNTGNSGTGAGLPTTAGATPVGNTGTGAVSIPSSTGSTGPTGSSGNAGAAGTPTHNLAVQPVYTFEKGPSAASLYLVLILVALAVLLGSQGVRYFSVRLALSGQQAI
jgi:hypothetical protein